MDPSAPPASDPRTDAQRLTRGELLKYGAGGLAATSMLGPLGPLASSALAGASATPKSGGSIKVAFSDAASSDSLDPATTFTFCSIGACGMIYDTLVRSDEQGWTLKPMLAQEWKANAKATSYTFKLRKG